MNLIMAVFFYNHYPSLSSDIYIYMCVCVYVHIWYVNIWYINYVYMAMNIIYNESFI